MAKADEIYNEIVDLLNDIEARGFYPSDIEEIMESVRDYAEARVEEAV